MKSRPTIDHFVIRKLYGSGAGKYEDLLYGIRDQELPSQCRELVDAVCAISTELDCADEILTSLLFWTADHDGYASALLQWLDVNGDEHQFTVKGFHRFMLRNPVVVADAPGLLQKLLAPAVFEASKTARFLVGALLDAGRELATCMEEDQGTQLRALTASERIMRGLQVGINRNLSSASLHMPVVSVRDKNESTMTIALLTQEELMTAAIGALPTRLYRLVKPRPSVSPSPEPTAFFRGLVGELSIKFYCKSGMDVCDTDPDADSSSSSSSSTPEVSESDYKGCCLSDPQIFLLGVVDDDDDMRPFRGLTSGEARRMALRSDTATLSSGVSRFAPNIKYNAPNGKHFTVKQLWECIRHYESFTRVFSDWSGSADCHHIFYEGLNAKDDGTLAVDWGC